MKGFTSILSSPKVSVGDPFLLNKENDRSRNPAGRQTLRDDGLTTTGRTAGVLVKRLVVVFMGLFAAVNAPAEIISAVSYNPSRMGDCVYLKVADKANLKGGIESNTMTVRSGGTVTATSPDLNYDVPAVVGASGSTLDMPNTVIHGSNANTYNNYQAVNTGTPSALLNNVNVNGGTTTVKSDSYISTLDAVNRLKQKAATLRANKLSVSGSEDASLYDGATTDGFTLAGNDIPQPTSSHVNTGSALSNCTLKWEERVTSDNQKVKLLALTNCGGSTPSTPDTQTCSNATYKASHKSECCPSALKTHTVCWTSKQETVAGPVPDVCSCRPCAMAALPIDENIQAQMCQYGGDRCHCILTWYVSGGLNSDLGGSSSKACSVARWQSCKTTYTKNGW